MQSFTQMIKMTTCRVSIRKKLFEIRENIQNIARRTYKTSEGKNKPRAPNDVYILLDDSEPKWCGEHGKFVPGEKDNCKTMKYVKSTWRTTVGIFWIARNYKKIDFFVSRVFEIIMTIEVNSEEETKDADLQS